VTETSLVILIWTAVSIGFIHTLIGPDHYLPFIAISKARGWSIAKTLVITIACGIGHVLSSIVIGIIGIAAGTALGDLTSLEKTRGDIASYALIAFGTGYAVWGLWRARYGHGHRHLPGGKHVQETNAKTITFWALFIIFVLGPCEPLIPLVMFPAIEHNWHGVALVALSFGLVTIVTMSTIVTLSVKGLASFRISFFEKYIHALAGSIIAISGLSIKLFGL
jgi:nickel/cobalt transporter (NicO) family protein